MIKKKLEVVKIVYVYSTEHTYKTYREIITPLKEAILKKEIVIDSVEYKDDITKEYYPYTKGKNWGSNLDIFECSLDKNLNTELKVFSYERCLGHSRKDYKFKLNFKLPENMLNLFKDEINHCFRNECLLLREKEIDLAEENRLKEIEKELLS